MTEEYSNKTHELKVWSEFYDKISSKSKQFEVRKNDRDFKVGDTLILREFIPCDKCNGSGKVWDSGDKALCNCPEPHGEFTGNRADASVDYVLHGGQFGIVEGYCVMSITVLGTRKVYK